MDTHIDTLAKKIWDYMLMHQEIKHADAIFALGSNDVRTAERAADLYRGGTLLGLFVLVDLEKKQGLLSLKRRCLKMSSYRKAFQKMS